MYRINRRPKDDVDTVDDLVIEQCESKQNEHKKNISVFMWLEPHHHYVGCLGQQSYSYAKPNDIIIAYNYEHIDKEWFFWLLTLNNLSPIQFHWIQEPKYKFAPEAKHLVHNDYFLKQLGMIISDKIKTNEYNSIALKPFRNTIKLPELTQKIKEQVVNDTNHVFRIGIAQKDWMQKFGTKACLHRFVEDVDAQSFCEQVGVFPSNSLTECLGFVCKNKEEILMGYDQLTQYMQHSNVVLKDCYGESGNDITFYKNKQDIIDNFEWKDSFKLIAIEEDLRFYRYKDSEHEIERVDFVGMSFYDNEVIGFAHEMIYKNGNHWGGSKRYPNVEVERRLMKITKYDVMNKIGTKWTGGFDFAIQIFKNKSIEPKIYLVDINTGRYAASTQTFMVMQTFDMEHKYFIRQNIEIKKDATFKKLAASHPHLLFNEKTKRGVYFHVFYPKDGIAILSVFGDNAADTFKILQELKSISYLIPKQ